MSTVTLYDKEGEDVGQIELKAEIFERQVNVPVMHQAVRVYLASQRRGSHDVKSRAEVSGGGKKPWRQKGTGRASFGSSRNPVWRKGGVAFGPTPRSHGITMPKKMRRLALLSALSSKAMDGDIVVVEELDFATPKTKELARVLANIKAPNALMVLDSGNENIILSARNLPGVNTVSVSGLNTYKVLYNEKLVLTCSSLALIEEVLG